MQQYYTSISNKEGLKDKIHEIHNYMRNHGIGYGMNALKTFNVLYGLKKIEDSGLIDVCRLQRPYCEFSYMVKLAHDGKHDELTECILRHALDSLAKSPLRHVLFYEIEGNVRASVFSWLVKEIDQVGLIEKTCNVLLSGKIYEYFIGRDETAISELGAYFTDRHIVDFIVDRLQPTIREDGTVYPMIDMFGGSGGFTTGYVQHLQQKYPGRVNWKTEIKNVYHYDMNDDVVKSARLELFCLTGAIPDEFRLGTRSSFADEFGDRKFHYILTNPPYGGDKQDTTEAMVKQQKIMDYIKKELTALQDDTVRVRRQLQLKALAEQEKQYRKQQDKLKVSRQTCSARINRFIVKNKISKANDKESCSLVLMMDLLDVGGTAVGVLKEGVFFNKTYKDIRRVLVENFNVREIISVPADQFENTSTKTSIVIFDNTEEKTSTVKFSDLVVERYSEDRFEEIGGDVYLVENKGDIKGVSASLVCKVIQEKILAHEICSLNPKEYLKREIIVGEGYELKRLGDIVELLPTVKHCTNIGKTEGKYRFYNSSQDSKLFVDFCEVEEKSLILGQGGNFNIHIDSNFTPSKHVCVLQTKDKTDLLLNYLYYMIPQLQNNFITQGSVINWLNRKNIANILIPLPQSSAKLKEWSDKISEPYSEVQTKRERVKELEKQVKDRILEITENEECDNLRLNNVCQIKLGTRITKNNCEKGNIPVYGGGGITFYTDKPNREKGTLIVSRYAMSKQCVRLIQHDFYLNDSGLSLHCYDPTLQKYLNFFILQNRFQRSIYEDCTAGSIQRNIVMKLFHQLLIQIPKNKQLIQDLEPTFHEIETLQHDIQVAEKQYKQYIQELGLEAMPSSS